MSKVSPKLCGRHLCFQSRERNLLGNDLCWLCCFPVPSWKEGMCCGDFSETQVGHGAGGGLIGLPWVSSTTHCIQRGMGLLTEIPPVLSEGHRNLKERANYHSLHMIRMLISSKLKLTSGIFAKLFLSKVIKGLVGLRAVVREVPKTEWSFSVDPRGGTSSTCALMELS